MDKIYEKLSACLTPEDLNEVKDIFEKAVDDKVQAKLDEETKNLAKKADEFCQKKINEAVAKKTAELEELANTYCEKRCKDITERAQKKLDSQRKKLEEAAQQYIVENFEASYVERLGKDLDDLEEALLTNLDRWLEQTITEKISPDLIQKQAVNETYAPIIEAIKSAFQDQYVALDCSGTAKIQQAVSEAAELRKDLKLQVESSYALSKKLEEAEKRALIAEKSAGLDANKRARVKNMFESRKYSDVKNSIDEYVSMLNESAPVMKRPTAQRLTEQKLNTQTLKVEDTTQETITEKYHPKKNLNAQENFLLTAARFSKGE